MPSSSPYTSFVVLPFDIHPSRNDNNHTTKWQRIQNALEKPIDSLMDLIPLIRETAYISKRDLSDYVPTFSRDYRKKSDRGTNDSSTTESGNSHQSQQEQQQYDADKTPQQQENYTMDLSALEEIISNWDKQLDNDTKQSYIATIRKMQKKALELPLLFSPNEQGDIPLVRSIKLRKKQDIFQRRVLLSRNQIVALLANGFFCTIPGRSTPKRSGPLRDFPIFNLASMFAKTRKRELVGEKLKCLLAYFETMLSDDCPASVLEEKVTFLRQAVQKRVHVERFDQLALSPVTVVDETPMEDYTQNAGIACVDFANMYIGGGVLGGGAVQEEILFLIHPECLVSLLLMQKMESNEAIIIQGARRFSNYTGYSQEMKHDPLSQEEKHRYLTRKDFWELIAIDAVAYRSMPSFSQYSPQHFWREVVKCCAGFHPMPQKTHPDNNDDTEVAEADSDSTWNSNIPIGTGNWGCGAFRGDPQFKFCLQLLVASLYKRPLVYFPYGDKRMQDLESTYGVIRDHVKTADKLLDVMLEYPESHNTHLSDEFLQKEFFVYLKEMVDKNKV